MTGKAADCVIASLQQRGLEADEVIGFDPTKTDARSKAVGETIKQVTLACIASK